MAQFELNIRVNGIEQTVKSVGELEKAIEATNEELAKTKQGSKEFGFLENQSKNLKKIFDAVNVTTSQFNDKLKDVSNSAKMFGTTVTNNMNISSQLDKAGVSVENLNNDIVETTKSFTSLRSELRQITQELQSLEPGSARFQELSVKASELRDTIADTNAVINSVAGTNTERLGKALGNVTQIGISGFQGLAGAAALFGAESEEAQQILVKLTALLNLSQAIETFGDLGQKFTEIKAGLGGLFAAQTAANTATEAGTVATSALGTAMKALPIVAIAAAVGTLVYGIYEYVKGSEESAKQEEIRKKKLEALKKAQDEESKSVSQASGEFVGLIYQLKQTNKGSEERKKLIDEINKTYGLTLKNLSDETQFQGQLNTSIEDYINLQYNKFKLQKNQEYFNQQLERQYKAEKEIAKIIGNLTDGYTKVAGSTFEYRSNIDGTVKTLGELRSAFQLENADLLKQEAILRDSQNALESLGLSKQKLTEKIVDLTDNGKKYEKQVQSTTTSTNEAKDANDELSTSLDLVRESQDAAAKSAQELEKERVSRTTTKLDDIRLERDIQIDAITKAYNASKQRAEKEITDEKLKIDTLKTLQDNYNTILQNYSDIYKARIEEQDRLEVDSRKKAVADLIIQNEILKKEVTFGNQDISDSLESLELRRRALNIKTEQDRIDLLKATQAQEISLIDVESVRKLENERRYLEDKYDLTITYNDQTKEYEVTSTVERTEEQKEIERLASEAINQTDVNLKEEAALKKAEIDKKYADEERKINEETFKLRISQIQDFVGIASQAISALENLQQISLNKQLAGVKKGSDEERNIRKKAFENQKKLQIANAVINGAQAVLQALASLPPPYSYVAAALSAVTTATQIGVIRSTTFDSGSETPADTPTPSDIPTPTAPNIGAGGFTSFNSNLSGNPTTGTGQTTPFTSSGGQLYVLESDITNTQNRVRVLESGASFG